MTDEERRGYLLGLAVAVTGAAAIALGVTLDGDGTRGGVLGAGGGLLGMAAVTVVRTALRR